MPTIDAIIELASRLAQEAADQLTVLARADLPSYEQFVDAQMGLVERGDDGRVRSLGLAAHFLVQATLETVHPLERKDDHIDPDEGYELLDARRYDEAMAFSDALLTAATRVDADEPDADLVHHAHILRGKVLVQRGDAAAAATELLAAGEPDASPVLGSFGPDLSLAWQLLELGEDVAVIGYLRRIAAFWSPRDPLGHRTEM